MNEVLNRTLAQALPVEEVFDFYKFSLQRLLLIEHEPEAGGLSLEVVLREFEIQLLLALGFMPDFQVCAETQEIVQHEYHYIFAAERGFIRTDSNIAKGQHTFSGHALIDVSDQVWNKDSLKVAKFIMRLALKPLLGDKPLKSRELFGDIR
jgi:DNA repair protein RecO (recombination protein O)